jgi:glutamate transport system permease protein
MLPTVLSQLVVVLKDTALGFIILYPELLYQARFLGGQLQLGAPILQVALVIAVLYIAMCLLLSGLAKLLERRLSRTPKGGGTDAATRERIRGEAVAGGYGGAGAA